MIYDAEISSSFKSIANYFYKIQVVDTGRQKFYLHVCVIQHNRNSKGFFLMKTKRKKPQLRNKLGSILQLILFNINI